MPDTVPCPNSPSNTCHHYSDAKASLEALSVAVEARLAEATARATHANTATFLMTLTWGLILIGGHISHPTTRIVVNALGAALLVVVVIHLATRRWYLKNFSRTS